MKVCIYHKNCFDGICSAWVVQKKYPDVVLYAMNYGESFPWDVPTNSDIIFVDFSLKRAEMLQIKEKFKSLLVIDHHKTAEAELEGLDFAVFDMNESGASLAWKHYFTQIPVPKLVRYIKDRDLWLFKETASQEVNAYIQSFPMEIEPYENLALYLDTDLGLQMALTGGESILRYKNQMVIAMCKYHSIELIGEHQVPVANASVMFSEVGDALVKMYPELPFSAYYFDRLADGKRQWGLRSHGDFDVSEVAKKFGGGGHKNAAGFIEDIPR